MRSHEAPVRHGPARAPADRGRHDVRDHAGGAGARPRDLVLRAAPPVARARRRGRARLAGDRAPRRRAITTCSGRRRRCRSRSCDAVLMRKDPPFDLDYYFATLLLERARGKTLIINDPRGLREQNEKLAVLRVPRPLPADDRDARGRRACARSWPSRAARWSSSRSTPPAASASSTCASGDPNTGAILEQATNLGRRWTMAQKYLPEVRAGRQAHPARRRRAAVRGAARARARRRARQPARRRASRWRPSSTSATRDRRARSARGCASAATSSSAST